MMKVPSVIAVLVSCIVVTAAHQAPTIPGVPPVRHQPQGGMQQQGHSHENVQRQQGQPRHHHTSFKDGAMDREHLNEHLDHMVNQDHRDTKHMTDDEVQFHYFKLHDYDDNNMLDGLELVSALTHYHKDSDEDDNHKQLSEKDLQDLVDAILSEDDKNNDGYVDYAEFILSQRG